jgi:hypothetical protein
MKNFKMNKVHFCSFFLFSNILIVFLEQREKIILKECQSHYKHEIDEYQKNLELSIRQTSDVQSELANLQEEKELNEKILNDMINSLKIDFEKQIEILKTQNIELKKQDEIKEQQLKKYQSEFNRTEELTRRVILIISKTNYFFFSFYLDRKFNTNE